MTPLDMQNVPDPALDDEINIPPLDPEEEYDPDELDPEGEPLDPEEEPVPLDPEEEQVAASAKNKPKRKGRKQGPRRSAAQNSRDMTYTEWMNWIDQRVGWDAPGVEVRLVRVQPEWHKGIKVGGLLDTRESAPFTEKEIQGRFGGGNFEVQVTGSRASGGNLPPLNFKKRISIAGLPKVGEDAVPDAERDASQGRRQHPQDVVTEKLYNRFFESQDQDSNVTERAYTRSWDAMRELTEDRAKAREDAAERQVRDSDARFAEAKARADQAQDDLQRMREDMSEKINASGANANQLVATLIPTFNDSATKQVENIMRTFESREARIETQHVKEIESVNRSHDAQLQQTNILHQAEMTRLETLLQGQLQMSQTEAVQLRMQLDAAHLEARALRDELMRAHTEQLKRYQQEQDPIATMGKYQQVAEFAREFVGVGGGGEGGEGLSEGAPDYMKMINNAVQAFGPAVSGYFQSKGEGQEQGPQGQLQPGQPQQGPQGAPQQMLSPEQAAQLQAAREYQEQQRAQQQGAPTQPPPPKPEDVVKVTKAELENALEIMANIRDAGTPPEAAAKAATQHLDQRLLKALADRPPAKVVEEIDRNGLLIGQLASEEGRGYLIEVLTELRQQLP